MIERIYVYKGDAAGPIKPFAMSPARWRVLQFIARFSTMPSSRAIAEHMGWKTGSGVSDVFGVLHANGYLRRMGRTQWELTDEGRQAVGGA